jgi:hypothetical protein
MSDQPIRRRKSNNEEVSQMMDEILGALDHIRKHMPNGELKIIQEKVEAIEESHEKLHDLLLDPENGVIVRVNKNTQFREENEKSMREKFEVLNEVNKWKDGINKAMWIIFAALIGIIFELFFKK